MTTTFTRFDIADHLRDDEDILAYLEAATQDGDPAVIAAALGDVARARNMTQIARDAGISREGLYKATGPAGNPSFGTLSAIARALGFEFTLRPIKQSPPTDAN